MPRRRARVQVDIYIYIYIYIYIAIVLFCLSTDHGTAWRDRALVVKKKKRR